MGLIKTLIIAVLIFFGGLFALGIYARENTQAEISEIELWELVQDWRLGQGMSRYERSQNLCTIANERMGSIFEDWSHDGFLKGSSKYYSVYPEFSSLGENLIKGFDSEEESLDAWLNSPSHRENLDRDFTHSCLRCTGSVCVQIFGK